MSEFKQAVSSDAFWLKTLYRLGFFVVYRILDIVVLLVAIAQWFFCLTSGGENESLARFGRSLGLYLAQIVQYLSCGDAEKPYPFQDWPS